MKYVLCLLTVSAIGFALLIRSYYEPSSAPETTSDFDLVCAELCEAIYSKKVGTNLENHLAMRGFDEVTCFEADGLRAAICSDKNNVFVVFRGTDNPENWITNANIAYQDIDGGTVHEGFYRATKHFYDKLMNSISTSEEKAKPIYVTGHSLGGAMATIFTYLATVEDEISVAKLITFGQPLTLDSSVARKLNELMGERYRRFVNETDIVTRLIPTFTHAGQRIHLTEDRASASDVGISTKNIDNFGPLLKSQFAKLKDDLRMIDAKSDADATSKSSLQLLSNHSMTGYISKIKKYFGKGKVIFETDENSIGEATTSSNQQLAIAQPGAQSGKLAVLIGINDYESPDISDLKGCVSDVEKMKELLLTKFGFQDEDILTLTNEQATKKAIIDAFENHLIDKAAGDKVALFYFSGHGSQMKDGVDNDEPFDQLDETIVPVDSRLPGKFDITDDQLNGLVNRLTAVTKFATVMLDCCHSGSGTRSGYTARRTTPDKRSPPSESTYSQIEPKSADTQGLMQVQKCALIFGCKDDELSYEMNLGDNNVRSGLLTHFFVDACRKIDGALTYQTVMDYVTSKVEQKIKFQHPQLEGMSANTHVFGIKDQNPIKYTNVKSVAEDSITLGAGTIHGVTVGSVYTVVPASIRASDVEKDAAVKVKITEVEASESTARIFGTNKISDVKIGSKAIEISHTFNDPKISIFVGNPLNPGIEVSAAEKRILNGIRQKLTDKAAIYSGKDDPKMPELKYIDRFQVVNDPSDAKLFVVASEGLIGIFGGDVEVNANAQNKLSKWSIPISLEEGKDSTAILLEQLVRWSQWFERLELENHSQGPAFEFSINAIDPLKHKPLEVSVGTEVEIHFKNNHSKNLYFSIIDFSTDGQIGMIFPPIGAPDQAVKPGNKWMLGKDKTPSTTLKIIGDRKEVTDHFKIFVSELPIRLDALVMPPIGVEKPIVGRRGIAERLERLVDRMGGIRTKNGTTIGLVDTDSWATRTSTIRVLSK